MAAEEAVLRGRTGGPGGGRGGRGGAAAQGADAAKLTPVNTEAYDPLLGRTYAEIGSDARSYHKCQGVGGLGGGRGGAAGASRSRHRGRGAVAAGTGPDAGRGAAPAGRGGGRGYSLVDTTIAGQVQKQEASLFDGIDTSLTAIAQYAGTNPPRALTEQLAAILADAKAAQKAFAEGNDAGTAAPVEAGLAAIRSLRAQLGSMGLSDAARYEIDFRLKLKERDYQDAVLAAHDITFDALADDGLVIAGQPVQLSLLGDESRRLGGERDRCRGRRLRQTGQLRRRDGRRKTPSTPARPRPTCRRMPDSPRRTSTTTTGSIRKTRRSRSSIPRVPFGVPFAPTPFRVTFHVKAGDVEVTKELPVEYRYVKDIYFGDKRMELNVVPAFSVRISPGLAVIPAPAGMAKAIEREIHVTVTNGTKGAAKATVALELPPGWKSTPATAQIAFAHEDESLSARFQVTPPPQVKTGDYTLRAVVTSSATGDEKFTNGYQEIEYPHIQRRQVIKPAETALKVVDVKTVPNVSVGYIVGVGDQVPAAIEQLGARLAFIDPDEMAWGDLSKHDVIVTGVRAYERRADLRAYNRRLLDFAERGGTVIVQYNKMEFNQAEYGPYPAKVSGNRVTR